MLAVSGCGSASGGHSSASAAKPGAKPAPTAKTGAAADAQYAPALAKLAARGMPVFCGGRAKPWVAFTFDDGPGPYTKLAGKILRHAHVPATFFLVGRNVAQFPAGLKSDKRVGSFGDHSWTHPELTTLSTSAAEQEIASTKTAIEQAAHRRVMLFRPPYGARNPDIDRIARRHGMVEVLWNIDSADSLGADHTRIARNVIAGLHPGSIVLMHENHGQTIRALKYTIMPHLKHRKLQLVTVQQMLAEDPPTMSQLNRGRRGCGRVVGRFKA